MSENQPSTRISETTILTLHEDYLEVFLKEGSEVEEQHMLEDMRLVDELNPYFPINFYADLSGVRSVSREAREYLSSEIYSNRIRKLAVRTPTAVSRVIGNFFIGLNRPAYPVKLFTEKEKALAWLRS